MARQLLSTTSRVSAPVIIAKIGDASFGLYNKKSNVDVEVFNRFYKAHKVLYPNYLTSLEVVKLNGTLNTYTLKIEYQITQHSDPNLIDKLLSTVSSTRRIEFTYGDAMLPQYMYRNEVAIITEVSQDVSTNDAKISYTLKAVSTAIGLSASIHNFPARSAIKPSTVIMDLLSDKNWGLQEIFYGMNNLAHVKQSKIIPGNDRAIDIPAKTGITVLEYLRYLVDIMVPDDNLLATQSALKTDVYVLVLHDDVSEEFPGPYFTITQVSSSIVDDSKNGLDYYEVTIGYPDRDYISSFTINNNQAYSILYDYSEKVAADPYIYRIDDEGEVKAIGSPNYGRSKELLAASEESRNWWSKIVEFPITAAMSIRGLLRAIILMSYIKINIYYFGRKYNASGIYIVTKQVDEISENGYKTTFNLTRVKGDSTV